MNTTSSRSAAPLSLPVQPERAHREVACRRPRGPAGDRGSWRGARRDSTVAVRVAIAAATDAARYAKVIAIGSAALAAGNSSDQRRGAEPVVLARSTKATPHSLDGPDSAGRRSRQGIRHCAVADPA